MNPVIPEHRQHGALPLLPLVAFALFLVTGTLLIRRFTVYGLAVVAAAVVVVAIAFTVQTVRAEKRFNADAAREYEEWLR